MSTTSAVAAIELVCTEAADWRRRDNRGTYVDNIYVMVYDTRAVVAKEYGDEYAQADGFTRAVLFVRSDDFMNW